MSGMTVIYAPSFLLQADSLPAYVVLLPDVVALDGYSPSLAPVLPRAFRSSLHDDDRLAYVVALRCRRAVVLRICVYYSRNGLMLAT